MAREFEVVANPLFRNLHVFLVRMLSRAPHIHRELEIGFVLQGRTAIRVNSQTLTLGENEGYLINPLEAHEFLADGRDALILAVQISPRILESFFAEVPNVRYPGCSRLRSAYGSADVRYYYLRHLCVQLARRYLGSPEASKYDCFALAGSIIAQLNQCLPSETLPRKAWLPIRQRTDRILSITDYIDENFRRKLLLEEIAEREGLSMPYLSHFFREMLGMSFQEYLKKKRFEYARSLILGTRRSILDISLESGFSDARYMIQMFEAEFGCTPRDYRRRIGRAEARRHPMSGDAQTVLSSEDALSLLDALVENPIDGLE